MEEITNKTDDSAKTKQVDNSELKADVQGYRGGMRLDLKRMMANGKTLGQELSSFICDIMRIELKNREAFIGKMPHWQRLYACNPEPKTSPWESCANVARPFIRTSADTVFVRNMENLFNKQKAWIVTAKKEEYVEFAKNIEDGLDWLQINILKLRKKLHAPLLQAIKIGTGYAKLVYEEKKKIIYRYATNEDEKHGLPAYQIPGSKSKAVKRIKTVYSGPNLYPIPREDWIQSSDSVDFEESILCGHRFYLRPNRIRLKERQGLFFSNAVSKLLGPSKESVSSVSIEGEIDEVKKARAGIEYKALETVDSTKPIPFWELHVKYDVDEDGEEDDIIIVIHYESGIIMDAIYNPLFGNFRPFEKFIFYPVEYSQDGEGVCQILEAIQEEINTLGNQRIDRVTEINCPVFFIRSGSGLEGLKKITPGKVYIVDEDPEGAIKEFRFSDTTISSVNEEERLIALGKEAIGLTPAVQGLPTSERPVAKETWSQIEESNKKFKYGQDNIREGQTNLAFKILDFLAQYQPTFTYYVNDEKGFPQERTVEFPTEDLREILDIRLASSSEILNQSVRQQMNLTLYQMISDYLTKIGGMGQVLTSPKVPSEFKKLIIAASDVSSKVLKRIIDDFPTVPDSEAIVLDLRDALDLEKCLMESADIIQAQQAQQAQGQMQQPEQGIQPVGQTGQGGQPEQPIGGQEERDFLGTP